MPDGNTQNTSVELTDRAARRIAEICGMEGNAALMLRLEVLGGGCSGFQYGFTFDEKIQEGDSAIEKCGVKLLVDPTSIQYLRGAEIDYKESLEGSQFIIKNPNAKTTCGCGSSFST